MICRSCQVEACEECLHNGADVCKTCSPGYELLPDGSCKSKSSWAWIACLVLTGIFTFFVLVYTIQLCIRPNVNNDAVQRGIRDRFRSRNRNAELPETQRRSVRNAAAEPLTDSEHHDSDDPRGAVYPLTTNLCMTPVAGPGLMLYFNFQCFIIIWAILVLLGWTVTASFMTWDLFSLGIKEAETTRDVCANVNWGHETQKKYMLAKVAFMGGVYVFTFFMLIIHATLQHRRYQDVDDSTTMKDFCAFATGLPEFHGAELAEDRIKQVIEAETGQKVVGVSMCWNFGEESDKVRKTLEYEMCQQDAEILSKARRAIRSANGETLEETEFTMEPASTEPAPEELSQAQRFFRKIDDVLISVFWGWEQAHDPNVDEETLVKSISSHSKAFIVFHEEAGRDRAVDAVKRMANGLQFEGGSYCRLYKQENEPEAVRWDSFGYSHTQFYTRLAIGLFVVFLGLLAWAVIVYVPYAYYFTSYPYAQGAEPGYGVQIAFTLLITVGNELLYYVTGAVCEWVGFRYTDGVNTAYLLIYSGSCFLCVILDLIISCYMVYMQLKKTDAFTSSGKLMIDLSSWIEIFESYPMQKALGWELFLFAFPACFLLPFILEPLMTIWLPYWLGWGLVRSRKDLGATMSEKCLGFTQDIELARYADLILNMMLCVIILVFPSGYILLIFSALLVSHLYIYWLDHWKTLRAVRNCYFSSQTMDVSASAFCSVPMGLLLCAIIFKFHCMPGAVPLGVDVLTAYCVLAFVAHVTVHVFIVLKVVPKLGKRGHIRSTLQYPESAKMHACNWFTSNPVHCLRSQYLYKHSPACCFFVEGKENLIHANPDIGVYYQEKDDDWFPSSTEDETKANKLMDNLDEDNDLAPIVDFAAAAGAPTFSGDAQVYDAPGDDDIAP